MHYVCCSGAKTEQKFVFAEKEPFLRKSPQKGFLFFAILWYTGRKEEGRCFA